VYAWALFLHLASVFGFLMAHGVSAGTSLQLRKERAEGPARALVELSTGSLYFTYAFLLTIIATGVLLGFLGGWWRHVWIWASLVLVVALIAAMGFLAGGYHGSRQALGIGYFRSTQPPAEGRSGALQASLDSARPGQLLVVGVAGLPVVLWLMVFKPF